MYLYVLQANLHLRNIIFPFLNWGLFDLRKIYVVNLKTSFFKKMSYVCRWICKLKSFLNRDSPVSAPMIDLYYQIVGGTKSHSTNWSKVKIYVYRDSFSGLRSFVKTRTIWNLSMIASYSVLKKVLMVVLIELSI